MAVAISIVCSTYSTNSNNEEAPGDSNSEGNLGAASRQVSPGVQAAVFYLDDGEVPVNFVALYQTFILTFFTGAVCSAFFTLTSEAESPSSLSMPANLFCTRINPRMRARHLPVNHPNLEFAPVSQGAARDRKG